ncbi:MAG: HAD family phosphatase [Eubacteriaceae bacterium]|nr:HAD family phosphatase [Eubacteriaceae bacterium]
MDGVIIDSEPLHFECDSKTLLDYGVAVTYEEMQKYVGVSNPRMWKELIHKYNLKTTVEEMTKRQDHYKSIVFNKENIVPVEGTIPLIKFLFEKKLKIGLASSSPRYFIEKVLDLLEIREYFHALVSGDEVTRSKPEPDIFLKAASMIRIEPDFCLAFEDAASGVEAAKAAGMFTIGYSNPNSGAQDLTPADLVVSRMDEALNYLMDLELQN